MLIHWPNNLFGSIDLVPVSFLSGRFKEKHIVMRHHGLGSQGTFPIAGALVVGSLMHCGSMHLPLCFPLCVCLFVWLPLSTSLPGGRGYNSGKTGMCHSTEYGFCLSESGPGLQVSISVWNRPLSILTLEQGYTFANDWSCSMFTWHHFQLKGSVEERHMYQFRCDFSSCFLPQAGKQGKQGFKHVHEITTKSAHTPLFHSALQLLLVWNRVRFPGSLQYTPILNCSPSPPPSLILWNSTICKLWDVLYEQQSVCGWPSDNQINIVLSCTLFLCCTIIAGKTQIS